MHVYELPAEQYALVLPVFETVWFDHAVIEAVLEGRQAGRIFVDRLPDPSAALLCHPYEFYIAGPVVPALRRFIKDAPAEVDIFHTLYGYAPAGQSWEAALLEDYAGQVERIPRLNFAYPGAEPPPLDIAPPAHVVIQPLDRALAERVDRELSQRVGLYWGGYEGFLERGFGFAALVDGAVASVAYSHAASAHYASISVETAERFRRQGLAAQVCQAFIRHALERGLQPTWESDGPNVASGALARRLGFQERKPFCQISAPWGSKLPSSEGRWQRSPETLTGWPAVTIWQTVE
jgi:GNAT superfamily N-acetyltransferase